MGHARRWSPSNKEFVLLLDPLNAVPDHSAYALLTINALAPLSMVAKMPGKYYRCQPAPTPEMLYGMLENALGWHIETDEREQIIKQLEKRLGKAISVSGVGFRSLLQYHLRFGVGILPAVTHYNDLWSRHLHTTGQQFTNGSREHSYEAIPLINAMIDKRIQVSDRAGAEKNVELLTTFQKGQTVHLNVLRPYFPQYYVSPTAREYIIAEGPYQYRVDTSPELAVLLADAIANPAAPLYLGSNDGWVDVEWRPLP